MIRWLPILGIFLFLLLYFIASNLYPGGTELNPGYKEYKWTENYLCDLMSTKTYSGQSNPANPVAVFAMTILTLSLIPFWKRVSIVFSSRHSKLFIGHTGVLAMVLAALVFTPFHDQVIYSAGPLGFIAFGASVAHIRKQRFLFSFSLLPIIFMSSNFLFWHFIIWIYFLLYKSLHF